MQFSSLSSRERVRLALEHQKTDRIPFAMVCSGINEPARTEFARYVESVRHCSLESYLNSLIDIKSVGPAYIGPQLAPGTDIWGVVRKEVQSGLAVYTEIAHNPLASFEDMDGIVNHPWPDANMFDYASLPERIKKLQAGGEHCLIMGNGNIFETGWYMRGLEQMFMDLVLEPEMVHAIMQRITDFYLEYYHRTLAAANGEIDLAFTADDIGGQTGLLMSLGMWEEFIKPYHVRLNAAIHEYGARVIYHTDGAIMQAIPGLVDMGIDVLQALQFDAADMDASVMKELYGDKLCFEGGVSVQQTLPFGTPDQVREEVEHLITTLGRNGGYILGPAHCIQAGTPPENIYAMFETGLNFYPH